MTRVTLPALAASAEPGGLPPLLVGEDTEAPRGPVICADEPVRGSGPAELWEGQSREDQAVWVCTDRAPSSGPLPGRHLSGGGEGPRRCPL